MIDDDAREAGNRNSLRMLGGLVRLSFHDCVGEKCDGCINNQNPENAGLGPPLMLSVKVKEHCLCWMLTSVIQDPVEGTLAYHKVFDELFY